MKHYLILISIALILSSCTKTGKSPQCWGDCKEATFFHAPDCATITGFLVFKNESHDTIAIIGSIPKKYRQTRIEIKAKIKEQSNVILTADCASHSYVKIAKIKCIKED